MTEKCVSKPWTKHEDDLLRQAVAALGENDNWKNVALYVPGRTNKACRKRWLHSLSPNVKKTSWTPEEDKLLVSLHAMHGTKWSYIARHIPGRTDDACSKRYREALDPTLNKEEWTAREDERLLELFSQHGGKWLLIGQELNRSRLACRNRWRMLERKKGSASASMRPQGDVIALPTVPPLPVFPEDVEPHDDMNSWDAMQYMQPAAYWDPDQSAYASTSMSIPEAVHDHSTIHDSTYVSQGYSPTHAHELSGGLYGARRPTPPPFHYSSSSLNAALSLPATSPPQSYLPTPASSRLTELSTVLPDHHLETVSTEPPPSHSNPPLVDSPPMLDQSMGIPSLGSTDISVPVPFPESPQESVTTQRDTTHSDPSTPHGGAQSYPTPASSPIAEPLINIVAPSDGPEKDPLRHYRTPAEKRKASATKPVSRKKVKESGPPPRLSATLPVTDGVLAYVCGNESCWPAAASMSTRCFATSQELCDHWKVDHGDDRCDRPFRCGIADCGKSWKSINGLQYHLQISKAHFQQAVTAKLLSTSQTNTPSTEVARDGAPKRKLFRCPQPDCPNQYKQLSGLRYHLEHGHNQELPTQLDMLPPALARKLEKKIQGKAA